MWLCWRGLGAAGRAWAGLGLAWLHRTPNMEGLVGSWCGPSRHFSTTCSGLQPLSLVGCEGQEHGLVRTPYTYPMS